MSAAHYAAFERICIEHHAIVRLLTDEARTARGNRSADKDPATGVPISKSELYESAIITAQDAYALLLIATAEGFMRAYLDAIGVGVGSDLELHELIQRCRKECNDRAGRVTIRPFAEAAVHNLRVQRNTYAHGRGSGVFPSVDRVASSLGRFFADIPSHAMPPSTAPPSRT